MSALLSCPTRTCGKCSGVIHPLFFQEFRADQSDESRHGSLKARSIAEFSVGSGGRLRNAVTALRGGRGGKRPQSTFVLSLHRYEDVVCVRAPRLLSVEPRLGLLFIQGLEFDSGSNHITINAPQPCRATLKAGNHPPPPPLFSVK